jgi:GNAT superfamily N-acetyltransferase
MGSITHPSAAVSEQYYREFRARKFVIQVPADGFLDHSQEAKTIIEAVRIFREHGIGIVLAPTLGQKLSTEIFGLPIDRHFEKPIVPPSLLADIGKESEMTNNAIITLLLHERMSPDLLPDNTITAERTRGNTGRIMSVDGKHATRLITAHKTPILPVGARDAQNEYVWVNPDDAIAEFAHEVSAGKLIFMQEEGPLSRPSRSGNGPRKISYIDHDGGMRRFREMNDPAQAPMVSKLWAGLRAVSGNVHQVHYLYPDGQALLDEVLTHTGGERGGTLLEYRQSRSIGIAAETDLQSIMELREACSTAAHHKTPNGTQYLKPMTADAVLDIIKVGRMIVFKHRNFVVGTIYLKPVDPDTMEIGGFAVSENHQNSQFGRDLLEQALELGRDLGCKRAMSLTASDAVIKLYNQYGTPDSGEFAPIVSTAAERYGTDGHLLKAYVFDLTTEQPN